MAASKRDYYEILGLGKTATAEEIKKTYRKKALELHPDKNPGNKQAEDLFKEATEAYSVLSDPEARRKYDQFGHAAFGQGGGGFEGFQGFGDFSGFEDVFGDLFGSIFGGSGAGRGRGRAGRDLKYDITVEFEEAAFGCEKEIEIGRRVACQECGGNGAEGGTKLKECSDCRGAGQVRFQQGFFTMQRACPSCDGAGQKILSSCKPCRGKGAIVSDSKIKVKIPAGIDHGQRLKLRGEGEPGAVGGPAGDLYVQIAIKPHEIFQREESEVVCEMPIGYASAVLGDELDVPTLEGTVKLKIPAGTPTGKVFRLKGKGIQVLGENRRGDQHVRVNVEVPKKISSEHRALLEKLKTIEKSEEGETSKFFDKVKSIFS